MKYVVVYFLLIISQGLRAFEPVRHAEPVEVGRAAELERVKQAKLEAEKNKQILEHKQTEVKEHRKALEEQAREAENIKNDAERKATLEEIARQARDLANIQDAAQTSIDSLQNFIKKENATLTEHDAKIIEDATHKTLAEVSSRLETLLSSSFVAAEKSALAKIEELSWWAKIKKTIVDFFWKKDAPTITLVKEPWIIDVLSTRVEALARSLDAVGTSNAKQLKPVVTEQASLVVANAAAAAAGDAHAVQIVNSALQNVIAITAGIAQENIGGTAVVERAQQVASVVDVAVRAGQEPVVLQPEEKKVIEEKFEAERTQERTTVLSQADILGEGFGGETVVKAPEPAKSPWAKLTGDEENSFVIPTISAGSRGVALIDRNVTLTKRQSAEAGLLRYGIDTVPKVPADKVLQEWKEYLKKLVQDDKTGTTARLKTERGPQDVWNEFVEFMRVKYAS